MLHNGWLFTIKPVALILSCMPWGDKIDKKYCFSLTDFHEFSQCQFRFFVKHHLEKKYELEEGNFNLALGNLLDQAIKRFHDSGAYGKPTEYLPNIVMAAFKFIEEKVASTGSKPSFYSSMKPFMDSRLVDRANQIFQDYYQAVRARIKKSLGPVRFCERVINTPNGVYKLWGAPDAYEQGEDGAPEIVDYKSREDVERGKEGMDMDLMPKIYTLLASQDLLKKGYKKARFRVRFWQDPLDESFYEEFDLTTVANLEELFKQKIGDILATREIQFCERPFCKACRSDKREEYLRELRKII